jgi:hypothetical protein
LKFFREKIGIIATVILVSLSLVAAVISVKVTITLFDKSKQIIRSNTRTAADNTNDKNKLADPGKLTDFTMVFNGKKINTIHAFVNDNKDVLLSFDAVLDNAATATSRVLTMVDKLADTTDTGVIVYTNNTVVNTANTLYKLSGLACGAVEKDDDGNETQRSIVVHALADNMGLTETLKKLPKEKRASVLVIKMPELYERYIRAWNMLKEEEAKNEQEEYKPFVPEITNLEIQQLMSFLIVRKFKFMPLKKAKKETLKKMASMTESQKLYWENVNKVKDWMQKQISSGNSIFKDAASANVNLEIEEEWLDA